MKVLARRWIAAAVPQPSPRSIQARTRINPQFCGMTIRPTFAGSHPPHVTASWCQDPTAGRTYNGREPGRGNALAEAARTDRGAVIRLVCEHGLRVVGGDITALDVFHQLSRLVLTFLILVGLRHVSGRVNISTDHPIGLIKHLSGRQHRHRPLVRHAGRLGEFPYAVSPKQLD